MPTRDPIQPNGAGNGSHGNGKPPAVGDETAELAVSEGTSNGKGNGHAVPPPVPPAPVEPVHPALQAKPPGFMRQSFTSFGRTLREATRYMELRKTPYGLMPALMMGIIFFVQSYDGAVFSLVLPNIVQDLEINAGSLISTLNILSFLLIFGSIALGYFLDRTKRVPFFAGGVFLGGLFSMFTSRSSSIWTIGASRMGDALGGRAASIPLFSLQADYYPPTARGRMFAFTATMGRLGTFGAPLIIAYLVAATSWRTPYLITGPILMVLGVVAFLMLKEPVRGYMERRALGRSDEIAKKAEEPPSFGEAWRTIWGIRTLRRLFVSSIVSDVSDRIFALLFGLFLFEQYRLGIIGRGWITFVAGIFALFGGIIGGGIIDSLLRRRPSRVLVFSGTLSLIASGMLAVTLMAPPLWVLYVTFSLFGFAFALLGPARNVFFATIIPAHMRTMGLQVFLLAAIPGGILAQVFFSRIPIWGIQGVLFAAVPFIAISAIIDISAAAFFERDMRNAMLTQLATEEYRKAREEGTLKLILCKGVEVEYSGVQVLFGVDFQVEEGEIVALLGTNGAGKSTLLRAIAGVHEASGGAIVLDGRDITHMPPHEITRRGIVMMPGGKGIFPGLTVRENLLLGTWGMEDDDAKVRLEEVMTLFPKLVERGSANAGQLSGGEQQMLALAMAFLARPRVLLIDELSLGLAPQVVQELLDVVRQLRDRGITIILVEQSVNVALTVSDRAVFMEKGEVRFSGPTADLLRRPDILRAVYVKGAAAMGGKEERSEYRQQRIEQARAALEVKDVTVSFGGVRALDQVTFDLKDGEILGIIGPNGAGKTTLFDVISGFVKADQGSVIIDGVDVMELSPDRRARGMQLVRRWQDARLYPSLTVHETLLVALDKHHRARSMTMNAIRSPGARASERMLRRRADELIELLGLGNARDKFIKELSTGMRRIVDMACAMATEPRVLLLDEPSSGIAQAEAEALAPLLRRVREETGCSMMLIEHDMPLITRASDELMAMVLGSVVARGQADVVLAHPVVVESYLGTSEEAIKRSGAMT